MLAALVILTTAVSMIVSSLYPRFRDLAIIWTVLSTILFYASPVLYPLEKVPGTLRDIVHAQPARNAARARAQVDRGPGCPEAGRARGRLRGLLPALGIAVATCAVAGLGVQSRSASDRGGALTHVVSRAVVAAVAALVLVWLGVMERDVRLQERGTAALRSEGDPGVLARAERDLRRAKLLNPGTEPDVTRALVRRAGETEASRALVEDVLRREPDNVTAWRVLMVLAPDRAGRSLAEQRRLDPLNAPRR